MALGLSHAFAVPKRRRRLAEGKLQRLPRRRRRRRRRRLHRNKYRQTAMDQRGAASRGGRGGASGRGSSTACSASSRHLIVKLDFHLTSFSSNRFKDFVIFTLILNYLFFFFQKRTYETI